ncbi:MAG TPA: ice-binding family protein [Thermoanaerobaculia bacterium]|nr:ice-binding family protein [Thermoanaerobaculia bacterium]
MKCKYPILSASMGLVAFLLGPSPALGQEEVSLGAAERFAVLAGTAVTCTDSMVTGDVGVYPGSAITLTNCTITGTVHPGDSVAEAAYGDFLLAYDALEEMTCEYTIDGNLALASTQDSPLQSGVYCVEGSSVTTGGTLWLDGSGSSDDTWIFKIGSIDPAAFLEATNFTVEMTSGETCSNNVYWWVADYATLTDSVFIGSILAGAAITVTGGSLDGQALAKAAVTLTNTLVSVCGTFDFLPFPQQSAIKVTGGGQIPVPFPDSFGRATFGFNAQPDKKGGAKGHLNYVNHVTGLHVNGPVTSILVTAVNDDESPKTVLFSGTWKGGSFFVTVEDHGEPGTTDELGITVTAVTGEQIELTSQRVISHGNIQFHGK